MHINAVNADGTPIDIPNGEEVMTAPIVNVSDSAAADVATLVTDFNNLLSALAARGVITNT